MGQVKRVQPGASRTGKRMARHYRHTMARGMIEGWFVCLHCGLVAVCPGCVEVAPGEVSLYLCEEHFHLAAIESYGERSVWTDA